MKTIKKPYEYRGTSATHIYSKCGCCISLYINTNDNTEVYYCDTCGNSYYIDNNKNKWNGVPSDFRFEKEKELFFFH